MPGPAPQERRLRAARPRSLAPLAGPAHHERRLRDAEGAAPPARRRRLAASGRRHLGTDRACAARAGTPGPCVIASGPRGAGRSWASAPHVKSGARGGSGRSRENPGHRPLAHNNKVGGAGRGRLRAEGKGKGSGGGGCLPSERLACTGPGRKFAYPTLCFSLWSVDDKPSKANRSNGFSNLQ